MFPNVDNVIYFNTLKFPDISTMTFTIYLNATVLMAHTAAADTAGMGEDTITGRADRPELCRAASS